MYTQVVIIYNLIKNLTIKKSLFGHLIIFYYYFVAQISLANANNQKLETTDLCCMCIGICYLVNMMHRRMRTVPTGMFCSRQPPVGADLFGSNENVN